MRIQHLISSDISSDHFKIDGVPREKITLIEGIEYEFLINSSYQNKSIWFVQEDSDRDIIITSDGSKSYEIPNISSLRNVLPGLTGGELNDPELDDISFPYEISQATLNDLSTLKISDDRNEISENPFENPYVGVSVDGVKLIHGVDFSFDIDIIDLDGKKKNFLSFDEDSIPKKGSQIRVKWNLFPFSIENGNNLNSISLRVPSGPENKFKRFFIVSDDFKIKTEIITSEKPKSSISSFVLNRIPSVMRDNEVFTRFIKDYFEWVDVQDVLGSLQELRHIDETTEELFQRIKFSKLNLISDKVIVDQKLLLKHIIDFYNEKGNKRSFSFLMRILFNKGCEIKFPNENMFRLSHSKWIEPVSIRVISIKQVFSVSPEEVDNVLSFFGKEVFSDASQFGDETLLLKLEGTQIKGMKSFAEAIVEKVEQKVLPSGVTVTDLFLNDIKGEFIPNEIISPMKGIELDDDFDSLRFFHAFILPQVTGLKFREDLPNGGVIRSGDQFQFVSSTGTDAKAQFKFKKKTPLQIEKSFILLDSGIKYSSNDHAVLLSLDPVSGIPLQTAIYDIQTGAELRHAGHWIENNSAVSDPSNRLQDNHFYQLFSYVIQSEIQEVDFIEHFENILHPSGHQLFSEFLGEIDRKVVSPQMLPRVIDVPSGNLHTIFLSNDLISKEKLRVYSNDRMLKQSEFSVIEINGKFFLDVSEDVFIDEDHIITIEFIDGFDSRENFYERNKPDVELVISLGDTHSFTSYVHETFENDLNSLVLDSISLRTLDSFFKTKEIPQRRDEMSFVSFETNQFDLNLPDVISGIYHVKNLDLVEPYYILRDIRNIHYQSFHDEMIQESLDLRTRMTLLVNNHDDFDNKFFNTQFTRQYFDSSIIRVLGFNLNDKTARSLETKGTELLDVSGQKLGTIFHSFLGERKFWVFVSFVSRTLGESFDTEYLNGLKKRYPENFERVRERYPRE